jgi:hypothetical protein
MTGEGARVGYFGDLRVAVLEKVAGERVLRLEGVGQYVMVARDGLGARRGERK